MKKMMAKKGMKPDTMKPKRMDEEDMMFMEHMMPMKKTMKAGTKKKPKKA